MKRSGLARLSAVAAATFVSLLIAAPAMATGGDENQGNPCPDVSASTATGDRHKIEHQNQVGVGHRINPDDNDKCVCDESNSPAANKTDKEDKTPGADKDAKAQDQRKDDKVKGDKAKNDKVKGAKETGKQPDTTPVAASGNLPTTGASLPIVVGSGLVLIAVGAGTLYMVRRRARLVRFTA
jgi:hypothetical protein